MVIRCKGFSFDVDGGAHVCSGKEQADQEPTSKPGKGSAKGSGAKKNSKIFGTFSKGRGGGVSKVEKVATRKEGTKDLDIDTLSKKPAVIKTVNKAKAEERTQEQKHKKYDQLLSPPQLKRSHGIKDIKVENVPSKSARVKWDRIKVKERFQEQQEHKNEKYDQLVSPAQLNGNHGTEDIYIDNIPREPPVITRDKGNLKERNEEDRTNKYVVSSPQDGSNKKSYAKESSLNQKKNKTERASTLVLRIRLHCDGCIQKIQKCISRYKGVGSVAIDASRDQVSVTGVVEMKEFVTYLKDKIKRNVEVVSTRKGVDKEIKDNVDKGGLGGALYDVRSSRYGVLSSRFNFLIFYHNCYYPTIPS